MFLLYDFYMYYYIKIRKNMLQKDIHDLKKKKFNIYLIE